MQIGRDFSIFWIAGHLAADGQVVAAYGDGVKDGYAALFEAASAAWFFYPPVAFLLYVPLGFLPFRVACGLWVAVTGIGFAATIRAIAGRGAIVPAVAWPGAILCAFYGQNGLLLGALIGCAAVTLDRFPIAAGVAIGCLIVKPQVAILAPLVLALMGRWRAFVAAGVTVALLAGISVLFFGVDSWSAFVEAMPKAQASYASGAPGFPKFISPFTALRLLGVTDRVAWGGQAICAAAAVAGLIWAVRRAPNGQAAIAAMVAATGLCVPFMGEYDMPFLAIPAAWLFAEAKRSGALPFERAIMMLLYIAPFVNLVSAGQGVSIAPLATALLLASVLRRLARPNDASL